MSSLPPPAVRFDLLCDLFFKIFSSFPLFFQLVCCISQFTCCPKGVASSRGSMQKCCPQRLWRRLQRVNRWIWFCETHHWLANCRVRGWKNFARCIGHCFVNLQVGSAFEISVYDTACCLIVNLTSFFINCRAEHPNEFKESNLLNPVMHLAAAADGSLYYSCFF